MLPISNHWTLALVIGNISTLAKFDISPEGGVMKLTRREFVKAAWRIS